MSDQFKCSVCFCTFADRSKAVLFMDNLCYLCLVFVMLSRLFIDALRSHVIKLLFHLVCWDRCGT